MLLPCVSDAYLVPLTWKEAESRLRAADGNALVRTGKTTIVVKSSQVV